MPVSLAQYREKIVMFYDPSFAPDLCYKFTITNFMSFLIRNSLILLLRLVLFISLLIKLFSDFLRLQSRSKFIITSLFFTVAMILTDNLWYVFYLVKILVQNLIPLKNLASTIGV